MSGILGELGDQLEALATERENAVAQEEAALEERQQRQRTALERRVGGSRESLEGTGIVGLFKEMAETGFLKIIGTPRTELEDNDTPAQVLWGNDRSAIGIVFDRRKIPTSGLAAVENPSYTLFSCMVAHVDNDCLCINGRKLEDPGDLVSLLTEVINEPWETVAPEYMFGSLRYTRPDLVSSLLEC